MVNQCFNRQITTSSVFFGAEPGDSHSFSVNHYLHSPRSVRRRHTTVFGHRIFVRSRHIMQICRPADIAQIAKTIIGAVAIYMVDMAFRPTSGHIQPRKPMLGHRFFTDKNAAISIAHFRPGALAHPIRLIFALQPRKNAGIRIVMDNLAQLFSANRHNTSVSVCPFCDGGNRNGNLFSGATLAAGEGV